MDFLIGCGTWIAGKIAECTVAPVGSHLGYIYHYRRNVRALETETKEVNDKKKILEDLADEAKRRGENIRDHIQECLTKVVETTQDAQNLINTNIKCSLRGCFSSLVERYRLSKRAKEMTEHVVEIKGKIRFDNISFLPKPKNIFENKDYLNSATRDKFVDGIRKVLEDRNIRTIGIHGMPGAGKTTLAKEIARKALSNDWNLFDDAVIVTVSQTPNFKKIQQQIAERLNLKLEVKTESERALRLRDRLKKENRFLIILDDIWNDELKLENVGIVFGSDQQGCKILMTSRFERVLGNDIGVDKNFKVDILSEDEARNWFGSIVGDQIVTSPAFQKYGNKIVEKCGRLPLCIVTAAHSLKNCDKLPLWKIAWRRLKRSKHDEVVHTAIKLCYDKLRSDEAKQLLMLCSLHEEDANIKMENLMRYCKGQINMFEDAQSLQEARDVVYCLVEELKDCCLLLDGDDSDTVKMHDVVRDVAISIAKESRGMHCFGDGSEVEKFLEKRRFEDLEALSLPNGYLDELVFERSKYTRLQLMICMWKGFYLKIIPRDFFERTEGLRGLVFSRNELESPQVFASHLSPLQNLRSLCLPDSDVEDIAEIGKLKKLEILDLSGSYIKKLPSEIGQLTRLRMLDLNDCEDLQVIEPNVIPHLNRLEELYVDAFENWHRVDQVDNNGKRSNAGLDELNHLDHLTALHLFVGDVNMLPKDLLSQQLKQYKIIIKFMGWSRLPRIEGVSRQLQIKHTESSLLREHGLEMLMKKSEQLLLEGLHGVNDIVSKLDTQGFPKLKILELIHNNTIQHLVNSMGEIHLCTVFGRLEALFLEDLSNLQQICHGEVTVESFKMLRAVTVSKCNRLKKLLPLFNARQIEEIRISDCNAMEEIFTHEIQDDVHDDDDNKEELLQLRTLELKNLSKLRELCSEVLLKKIGSSKKQKEPFVEDCIMPPLFNGKFLCFPKLEKFVLRGCHVKKIWDDQFLASSSSFCCLKKLVVANCKFLKCVVSSSMAANFKQLSHLEVTGCEAMEIIVSRDERTDNMSFPKLSLLRLSNLPRLSKFSSGIFSEFPMLCDLDILVCPELKSFISESSEEKSNTTMPSLFNETFICFPKLENLELSGCHVQKIWDDEFLASSTSFCCLKKLEVWNCKFLKCVVSSSTAASFKQLEDLTVIRCEAMELIVRRDERMDKMSFPKLSLLRLRNLPRLSKFSSGIFCEFPMLRDLDIWNCPELKTFISESFEEKANTTMPSLFNENVAFPSLKTVCVEGVDGLKMIWQYGRLSNNAESFCQLEDVEVKKCKNLMGIFSSGMDTRLGNLKRLRISECEMVEEIFEMETSNCGIEDVAGKQEGLETVVSPVDEFVFPQLWEMELKSLPNLVSFYAGRHTLSFPLLEELKVIECLKVKAFSGSELLSYQGRHESLFSTIFSTKVTFGRDRKCKIKLRKLPNLMHLMEEEEEESSQEQPQTLAFPYMIDLEVVECGRLENLVPSSISFQNLNSLMLTDCDEMLHLLSSQTAKSMTQLRRLEIRSCKRMEEIISDAGVDHSKGGEIVFTWLDQLVLDDLPTLANFYSGNYTIRFPNLKFLRVNRCFEMQNFSKHSIISTQQLEKISINGTSYLGPELESMLKSESETESSSNSMVGINSIIAKAFTTHHRRTALQELSTEKDITPLNPSEE